jgi:hypothetical protein
VEEYCNRFQALLPRAGRLDEIRRVQLFTGGLLPPLYYVVRLHNLETLAAAMSLARQVELMEMDRQQPAPTRPAARGPLPPPPPRLALAAPPPQLALLAPLVGADRRDDNTNRLSMAEQAERRRLCLCFNCDEKYCRGHNRFCKRIFFVDGVELADADNDDAAEGDKEAPCFSL